MWPQTNVSASMETLDRESVAGKSRSPPSASQLFTGRRPRAVPKAQNQQVSGGIDRVALDLPTVRGIVG
jgi:hypothetical protein